MVKYIFKRLGQTVIVLFFVSVIAFLLIRLAGGNPALLLAGDGATDAEIAEIERSLGLDQPLVVQYFKYIGNILRGDLGRSTSYGMPVANLILSRFPNTLKLASVTVLFGCILAIPLGIIAGSHQGTVIDFFATLFALLGQSMANMWKAVVFIYIFSVWLGWLPSIGMEGGIKSYVLPVMTLGWQMSAQVTRISRSGMIDTLHEDFITATYAKGIHPLVVRWKYAFKNAVCPVITLVGMRFGTMLAGTIIVEAIFSWPGLGQLLNTAVNQRDYALVQALLLLSGAMFAIINFAVDIINSLVDPRIKLR